MQLRAECRLVGRGRLVDDGMTRHRRTYGIEARSRGGPHGGALPATVPGFIVQIYAHCSVKQKADPESSYSFGEVRKRTANAANAEIKKLTT